MWIVNTLIIAATVFLLLFGESTSAWIFNRIDSPREQP